jgi:hypothetical protein
MAMITIDGKEYEADALSPEARAQLMNLQVTDQKIAELQSQMAIYQTARGAYAHQLLALLPADHVPANTESVSLVQ